MPALSSLSRQALEFVIPASCVERAAERRLQTRLSEYLSLNKEVRVDLSGVDFSRPEAFYDGICDGIEQGSEIAEQWLTPSRDHLLSN